MRNLEMIMSEEEIKLMNKIVVEYKKEVLEFLSDYLFAKKLEEDPEGKLEKYRVHLMDVSIGLDLPSDAQEKINERMKESEEDSANYIF